MQKLIELETVTAELWSANGVIHETSRGDENTYYCDEFGTTFFCKNL